MPRHSDHARGRERRGARSIRAGDMNDARREVRRAKRKEAYSDGTIQKTIIRTSQEGAVGIHPAQSGK